MRASHIKYYVITAIVALAIASCTKVIDLKLGNNSGQLVIEANVDNENGYMVKLSRNVPFTSTNTYPPVTGAKIIIQDNTQNYLVMQEMQPGTYGFPKIFNFKGVSGRTYTLTVQIDGKTYTAISTMPKQVQLDSITSNDTQFNKNDKQKGISVYFQDPASQVNQYRFIMTVNGIQVKDVFAYNDDFTNGRYTTFELLENDINVYTGDTVKVEMQCIDKNMYKYWLTLSQEEGNSPGGIVTPSNPPTNITPVTLGYFSAHTTQSLTLVVK